MAKVVRTVRFDKAELDKIELFLKKNSFFDFSTLARFAINHFIESPPVKIRPLIEGKRKTQRDVEV